MILRKWNIKANFANDSINRLDTRYCVSLGIIGLPEDHPYYNVDYEAIPIDCHGGLTYGSNNHNTVTELRDNGYFIGWDYGHYGDYMSFSPFLNDKKWTTMEIINECFNVIDQLEKLKQKALEE